jgi:hypothetical protein
MISAKSLEMPLLSTFQATATIMHTVAHRNTGISKVLFLVRLAMK